MIWIAYSIMWLSIAIVAIVGIYLTNSLWCLWVLIIPLFINVSSDKNKENCNNKELEKKEDE